MHAEQFHNLSGNWNMPNLLNFHYYRIYLEIANSLLVALLVQIFKKLFMPYQNEGPEHQFIFINT